MNVLHDVQLRPPLFSSTSRARLWRVQSGGRCQRPSPQTVPSRSPLIHKGERVQHARRFKSLHLADEMVLHKECLLKKFLLCLPNLSGVRSAR